MSKVEVPVEFLGKVAEYIKVASEQNTKLEADIAEKNKKIAELSKVEKVAAAPALAEADCKVAAEKLVTAGLLSAENKDAVAKSLSDPKNVMSTLNKVAEAYARRPLGVVEKTQQKQTKTASALDEARERFATSIGVRH